MYDQSPEPNASRFVDERQSRAPVLQSLAEIEPEHAIKTREPEPQTASDIDIPSPIRISAALDSHGIDKHAGTKLDDRSERPPLPSLAREVHDSAAKSLGLQHSIVHDRMRAQERRTHSASVAGKPQVGRRRGCRRRTSPTEDECSTSPFVARA